MSSTDFPYADRFAVNRTLPERGTPREEVLAELRAMATEEDAFWETGKCSGTMYCGDHEHYDFLNEAFGLFAHVNALQRDMCPSATKFEGEIIAMALDLMHADAVTDGDAGGPGHHRRHRQHPARACSPTGSTRPQDARHHRGRTSSSPRPAHPAFDKACHLFGIELRERAGRPGDHAGRRRLRWPTTIDDQHGRDRRARPATTATAPSTRSRSWPSSRWSAASGCTSTAASAASSCRSARSSGYDIPVFDFRRARRHQHLRRHPQVRLRVQGHARRCCSATRRCATRSTSSCTDWSGGKYCSPGIEGSRSGGLLAATWASMVQLGREGYRELREADLRDRGRDAGGGALAPRAADHGRARRSCFSFTSDEFDIYHVNDFMRPQGWRFNGQQYPNALHMAVTRPQTQPGVVEAFAADLAEAVAYAKEQAAAARQAVRRRHLRRRAGRPQPRRPRSSSVAVMDGMLDTAAVACRRGRLMSARTSGSSWPSTWAPAARRSAWSSLDRRGRRGGPADPCDRRGGRRRGATQDAAAWWRIVGDAARRGLAGSGADGEPRGRGERAPASGPARCRSTRTASPVGPCVMWMDTRGARALPRGGRRAAARATRHARSRPGSGVPAGVPSTVGRRPGRPHAAPGARRARGRRAPRAGTSSRSTTSPCGSPGWPPRRTPR